MPTTAFRAASGGFHFPNTFVNNFLQTPFGEITTRGRCGGMAFAALDYFSAHEAIPSYTTASFPDTGCPPDGDPLADHIYARLIDSCVCSTANQFVSWTVASDHGTWVSPGVPAWTKNDSWPSLMQEIDQGHTVALGLIQASSLAQVCDNHQVVAYGYSTTNTGVMTVFIYDNNYPDAEMTLQSGPGNPHWNESNGQIWRGWFVQDYSAKKPPVITNPARRAAKPQLKELKAVAKCDPSPVTAGAPVTLTVTARAGRNQAVNGSVRLDGVEIGPTNVQIKTVIRPHRRYPVTDDATKLSVPEGVWPRITVTAAGYKEAEVPLVDVEPLADSLEAEVIHPEAVKLDWTHDRDAGDLKPWD